MHQIQRVPPAAASPFLVALPSRIWSHTHLRIVSTTTLYRPVGPEELA
jgi:hypothetical protein